MYFWSSCSRIFVVTAFLLLRSPWQDGGRCQPRFDVTNRVGSLCESHHTLGFPTTFFFVCSLCATCSRKIDRALRTVFCRAVFFFFCFCLLHVWKRFTACCVQSSAALCFCPFKLPGMRLFRITSLRPAASVVLASSALVRRLIHDIFELLNGDVAALGHGPLRLGSLWLWQVLSFMVLARHTFALFISGFRLTTMRLLRRFRQAGCSPGGEWPLPPEGTARAEVFGVYHDFVKLLGDIAVLPSLQVRVLQASVQDTSMCILSSEESSFPLGVAAAPGRLRSSTPARPHWQQCGPLSLASSCASSRHKARRTCSPATWPSSAASRAASRRKRAPRLPAPSLTTPSKAWP